MSRGKPYSQELKSEAVKQIIERDYLVADVSKRLGISRKNLYHWRSQLADEPRRVKSSDDQLKLPKFKLELK